MKKINLILLISIFLSSCTIVSAQTTKLEDLQEKARLRAQQTTQKIQEAREKAQEKVQKVKTNTHDTIKKIADQKKRTAADKIIQQLDHVNKQWTDHFANVLDRLDIILQKVKSRTEKAQTSGKDVSSVHEAIKKAETAIANARTAVTAQAQKTYLPSTTAEPTSNDQDKLTSDLRGQFKTLKSKLSTDLKALRDGAVKDAKNAVHDSFKALTKVAPDNTTKDTN